MRSTVSFDRVQHLVRVPLTLGGQPYRFLVDTGIGITVVSSAVANRPDVEPTGETFTGERMSGQAVEVPLVLLPPVTLGSRTVDGHVAGVADLGEADGTEGFAGILGLGFFEGQVVATDTDAMSLTVQPRESFRTNGHEIPLEVRRHGPSVTPFTMLVLPSGRQVCVEVDTGSHNLILDTRFMVDCGVQIDGGSVSTSTGTDETGYPWTRRWTTIPGKVHLAASHETAQSGPKVQFQDIIHDGLLGSDYLERYRFSFDVSGARLFLSPRAGRVD